MIAYPGSFRFRAGKRTPQRYTYAHITRSSNTMTHKVCSLAETSGIRERPDT